MRDPAFLEPTTHGGGSHPLIRLSILLLIAFGLFFFVGAGTARADGLLDGVVEQLPLEQAADALPVDEVVDVLLPSPASGAQPQNEPPASEPTPATEAPAPETEPAAAPPAPPEPTNQAPALLGDTVSVVSDVVTTDDTPDETVSGVVSTVLPEPGETGLVGTVTGAVPDLEQVVSPVVDEVVESVPVPTLTEITPTISRVVESADGVIREVVETVETVEPPIDRVVGLLPPVLDDVLSPAPALIDETLGVVIETIHPFLPDLEPPQAVESGPSLVESPAGGSVPDERTTSPPGFRSGPLPGPGIPEISPAPAPSIAMGGRPDPATQLVSSPPPSSLPALPVTPGGQAAASSDTEPGTTSSDWVRGLDLAMSSGSTSGSGQAMGLLAVLVLTGLALPRLSRWLRLQPVLWRPYALAVAIERPG